MIKKKYKETFDLLLNVLKKRYDYTYFNFKNSDIDFAISVFEDESEYYSIVGYGITYNQNILHNNILELSDEDISEIILKFQEVIIKYV